MLQQQNEKQVTIAANVNRVKQEMGVACERAGRSISEVTLIAVSKTVDVNAISMAASCGITDFGENRLQEATPKIEQLPDLRWHFIGSLQSNKAKAACQLVQCIHSLDRPALVEALSGLSGSDIPKLLMQVNISGEVSKHGVAPEKAIELAKRISHAGLPLCGLMTIAPLVDDAELVRPIFRQLRILSEKIRDLALPGVSMECLSMGMSGDFTVAIEEGATMVRVGSAIFGRRY